LTTRYWGKNEKVPQDIVAHSAYKSTTNRTSLQGGNLKIGLKIRRPAATKIDHPLLRGEEEGDLGRGENENSVNAR
jgi:hypothetical protein